MRRRKQGYLALDFGPNLIPGTAFVLFVIFCKKFPNQAAGKRPTKYRPASETAAL
jgi:hypothetical protein